MEQTTPRIADYMTARPMSVAPDLSVADAQDRMYANNIRHLVVAEDKRVIGVISTRDLYLLSAIAELDTKKIPVSAAMTRDPFTCGPETPVLDVVTRMEEHRWGCVVVVEGGLAAGIFTTTDALRALREQLAGHPVEPGVKPSHVVEQPTQREHIEHRVRTSDAVRGRAVGPNLGRPFDK
ncbi:MAG: CBS domain-containing protein [Myxococcales bacterium]|nr:CBS domain-containing protein [Myxococcales bacterium]